MSQVTLLLQTSSGTPMLGLARGSELSFESNDVPELHASRDYRKVLEAGLKQIDATLSDIGAIFVDIGPGGLGVTRTGVAFANALGFALGLPTQGLRAFDLLGHYAQTQTDTPIVILRKAARPYVHFGRFEDGKLAHYEHCTLDEAQVQIDTLDNFHLVGNVILKDDRTPQSNISPLQNMLTLANLTPKVPASTRAYPIVELVQ